MTSDTEVRDLIVEEPLEAVTVRMWELPVRVTHWVIFIAVAVLSITGFYIGTPHVETGSEPGFMMARMRWFHLVSAWVFIAAIIARVIWGFTGNRHSHWNRFVPTSRERVREGREMLKFYLFLKKEAPPTVGHNALAGFTYMILYLMFGLQIVTGLALHGVHEPSGWIAWWTSWVFSIFSVATTRLIHHIIMWLTWGFVVHHVYSAILVDSEERSGVVSSIFTGYRRIPRKWL